MSSSSPVRIVNPKPFLASLVSHRVSVVLKWGQEYRGTLLSSDSDINLQLGDCEEVRADGTSAGRLGRCWCDATTCCAVRAAPSE